MTLVRTTRVGAGSTTSFGTGAYTPAGQPFTPQNDSLLLAMVGCSGDPGTMASFNPTISDSAGGSWVAQVSSSLNAGGWITGGRLFLCQVVTGSSRSVSVDHGSDNVFGYGVSIIEFVGHDLTTPVTGVVAKQAAINGADSVTLTAAPTVDDFSLGFAVKEANTGTIAITQGSGFTEVHDVAGSAGGVATQYEERTGSTSTTVDWADMNTGASDVFREFIFAINVKMLVGGGTPDTIGAILGMGS